jgi:hypothetical protein
VFEAAQVASWRTFWRYLTNHSLREMCIRASATDICDRAKMSQMREGGTGRVLERVGAKFGIGMVKVWHRSGVCVA